MRPCALHAGAAAHFWGACVCGKLGSPATGYREKRWMAPPRAARGGARTGEPAAARPHEPREYGPVPCMPAPLRTYGGHVFVGNWAPRLPGTGRSGGWRLSQARRRPQAGYRTGANPARVGSARREPGLAAQATRQPSSPMFTAPGGVLDPNGPMWACPSPPRPCCHPKAACPGRLGAQRARASRAGPSAAQRRVAM